MNPLSFPIKGLQIKLAPVACKFRCMAHHLHIYHKYVTDGLSQCTLSRISTMTFSRATEKTTYLAICHQLRHQRLRMQQNPVRRRLAKERRHCRMVAERQDPRSFQIGRQ